MHRRAIIRTAILAHWRHDATGRALKAPANDIRAEINPPAQNLGPGFYPQCSEAGAALSMSLPEPSGRTAPGSHNGAGGNLHANNHVSIIA